MRMPTVLCAILVTAITSTLHAGPNGTVQVPRVSDGAISIDGSFADWPLDSFTTVARQPEFPDAQDPDGSGALGDHILFEPTRTSYFGAPDCNSVECGPLNNEPTDFGSAIYMTYDSKAIYFLGVFLDDVLEDSADTSEFGDNTFRNDGFEIFVDTFNDSNEDTDPDGARGLNNPNTQLDDEEPNLDDFQMSFGLNSDYPDGARQHMERSARPGLLGATGPGEPYEEFEDIVTGERNGPGGIYRDALTAFGKDIAATTHEDMRAIGAPNPELTAHPDVTFPGYVLEAAIPFGFADLDDDGETNDDFVGVEGKTMGFSLFWNDTDKDADVDVGVADGAITRIFWTQGSVWDTNNWGQIEFVGSIGPDGDFNGNGELDVEDIDLLTAASASQANEASFDLTGDGKVDSADVSFWVNDLKNTWAGDSNLDGEFSSSDFVVVFSAGLFEKDEPAVWSQGDWNGDGIFNSSDFVAAFSEGGYEKGPRPLAAVPEPSGVALILVSLLGLHTAIRRRAI